MLFFLHYSLWSVINAVDDDFLAYAHCEIVKLLVFWSIQFLNINLFASTKFNSQLMQNNFSLQYVDAIGLVHTLCMLLLSNCLSTCLRRKKFIFFISYFFQQKNACKMYMKKLSNILQTKNTELWRGYNIMGEARSGRLVI